MIKKIKPSDINDIVLFIMTLNGDLYNLKQDSVQNIKERMDKGELAPF